MRGSGGYGRWALLKSTSLTYTLGDAPVCLRNAKLACQSVCHWSGMVQQIIHGSSIGINSVSSAVGDEI